MGATLDLNIVGKENIDINTIIKLIEKTFYVKIGVNEVEIIDDWKYSNAIYEENITNVYKYIQLGKIVNIQLNIDSEVKMGCQIEREKDIYLTSLWIDTSTLQYLDSEIIIKENEVFYEKIKKFVLKLFNLYEFMIASIGIESTLEYDLQIENIIRKSKNVNIWFVNNRFDNSVEKLQKINLEDKLNILIKS